jgi:hypothetical protein
MHPRAPLVAFRRASRCLGSVIQLGHQDERIEVCRWLWPSGESTIAGHAKPPQETAGVRTSVVLGFLLATSSSGASNAWTLAIGGLIAIGSAVVTAVSGFLVEGRRANRAAKAAAIETSRGNLLEMLRLIGKLEVDRIQNNGTTPMLRGLAYSSRDRELIAFADANNWMSVEMQERIGDLLSGLE